MTPSLDPDRLQRRREHLMTEIRTSLDTAAVPSHVTRPRARQALAAAAGVVALAVTGLALTSVSGTPGVTRTAFAIEERPGGIVRIRVVDNAASADDMNRQLRAEGLRIRVDAVAASPQLVGRWVWLENVDGLPGSLVAPVEAQMAYQDTSVDVPRDLPGELRLGVGRPTRSGEEAVVAAPVNELAPGGSLFCLRLTGSDRATAARTLREAGYSVTWRTMPRNAPADAGRVVFGHLDPATRGVEVTTMDPAHERFRVESWRGFSIAEREAGRRDYSTCS